MATLSTSLNIDTSGFIASIKSAVTAVSGLGVAATTPISIHVDTSQAQAGISALSGAVSSIPKPLPVPIDVSTNQAKEKIHELGETVKESARGIGEIGKGILSVFGGGVLLGGVSGIVGGFEKMLGKGKSAIEMQEVLKIGFRTAGQTSEEAEISLSKNAKSTAELSNKYAITKGAINEATSAFLRFGGSTDNLKQKQENIIGLAAKLGGNYELAARALAKATDPEIEGQLTKFGIKFAKNATEAERQQVITEKLGGTLEALAEKADSPLGKMEKVKNAIGGISTTLGLAIIDGVAPLMSVLGEKLLPLITGTISTLKNLIGGIKSFFSENTEAIKVTLSIVGIGLAGVAAVMYGELIPALASSAAGFISMGIEAVIAWGAASLPIVALVAGIAAVSAAVFYLYNNFEGFRNVVDGVWNAVQLAFVGIKDLISGAIDGIVAGATNLKNGFNGIVASFGGFSAILDKAVQGLQVLAIAGAAVVGYLIGANAQLIINTAAQAYNTAATWAKNAATIALNAAMTIWMAITSPGIVLEWGMTAAKSAGVAVTWLITAAQWAWNAAMNANPIGLVIAGIAALVAGVVYAYNHFEGFRNVINAAWEKIKAFGLGVVDFMLKFNPIIALFRLAYENIKPFRDFIDGLVQKLKDVGSAIGDFFGSIGSWFSSGDKTVEVKASVKVDSKENDKKILEALKKKAEELKKLQEETDAQQDEAKKKEETKKFNEDKKNLLKELEAKLASKKLTAEEEEKLRKEIEAITLEKKAKELKSLTEEIKKAKLENDKILSDIAVKAIDDEQQRDEKAAKEKAKNAVQAVVDEIDKVKAMENIVAGDQAKLIKELNERQKLIKQQGELELNAIKGKYLLKGYEESKKIQQDLSKREIEDLKANYEALKAVEGKNQTGGGLLADIEETNAAKLRLIDIQNEAEIDAEIDKNRKVIEARETLKKALLSNDQTQVDTANSELIKAVSDAEQNDTAVRAVKIKGQKALEDAQKESYIRLETARIATISDSAEREKAERELQIKTQLDSALEKAQGNERLIAEAHAAANLAKYNSDEEYARKTTDLNIYTAQTIKDLGVGIATNLKDMYGNTFDAINKKFDDFASAIQKKLNPEDTVDEKKQQDELAKLKKDLAKKEISYADYQKKLADLSKDGGKETVTAAERANLAIGKSFQVLSKRGQEDMNAAFKTMQERAKNGSQTAETFKKDAGDILQGMAVSVSGILGQMAAAGTLTARNAGKAAAAIALDTAGNIILAQTPVIFAYAMGSPLGLIGGAIAATLGIASLEAMLAVAKAAIVGKGFASGGYTGDGSPSSIAGVVHGREMVFESGITEPNKQGLSWLRTALQGGAKLHELIPAMSVTPPKLSQSYIDTTGKLRNEQRLQTAEFSASNIAQNNNMQSSLSNIEKSLANARIVEKSSTHVSSVKLTVEDNPKYTVRQNKAALRTYTARS